MVGTSRSGIYLVTVTLNFSLNRHIEKYIEKRVKTGGFQNRSDYVRQLIRQDEEAQKQEQLEAQLLKGLASGRGTEDTPDSRKEMRALVEDIIAKKNKK